MARFTVFMARTFSKRYKCDVPLFDGPCMYVCRHLNMHGPYTTLKWLPLEVHPFSLSVFFDVKTSIKHYTEYTFSVRRGKQKKKFSLRGQIVGYLTTKVLTSLRAVPVHRDAKAITTMRTAMKYLQKGESLVVWPDIHYTDGYDKPCEIYNGFLFLGEMYYQRTGQDLPIVPLYVDDQNRRLVARDTITLRNYKEEIDQVTLALQKALDA